jgi:hypothetical protein
MPGFEGSFDASQHTPKQGGGAHPIGKYPATITNTSIVPTKSNDGGIFVIELTTPSGTIENRYNLWNQSPKAVEIAHNELSAMCHATGVFKLDWKNEGAALRGSRCMIEVADQIDKQTKQPNGYVEVKKVYDQAGNEPGKPPANPAPQAAQPAQAGAPMTQQGNGGWGQSAAAPAAAPAPTGWNTGAQQTTQPVATGPAQSGSSAPPWAQPR